MRNLRKDSTAGALERVSPPGEAGRRRGAVVRMLQLGSLALVAGLLALLGWRVAGKGYSGELVAAIRDGKAPAAPAFELPVIWDEAATWPVPARRALGDGRLSLGELRGYPVVLNVWASWCVPCRDEAPILRSSAAAHAGSVVFLGLDVQDFVSDARRFLERFRVNYVSVRDGAGEIMDVYGATGVPETYYVDRNGRIVAHSLGAIDREQLEAGIAEAIEGGNVDAP